MVTGEHVTSRGKHKNTFVFRILWEKLCFDTVPQQEENFVMAPSGRKHSGKAGKAGQEEQARSAYDFQEERKDLSGSEEDIREGAYLLIMMIFLYFIFYNVSKPEQVGGYYGSVNG